MLRNLVDKFLLFPQIFFLYPHCTLYDFIICYSSLNGGLYGLSVTFSICHSLTITSVVVYVLHGGPQIQSPLPCSAGRERSLGQTTPCTVHFISIRIVIVLFACWFLLLIL